MGSVAQSRRYLIPLWTTSCRTLESESTLGAHWELAAKQTVFGIDKDQTNKILVQTAPIFIVDMTQFAKLFSLSFSSYWRLAGLYTYQIPLQYQCLELDVGLSPAYFNITGRVFPAGQRATKEDLMIGLAEMTDGLEFTASWRRDKAAQYADDTRNTEAAEILERLAIEVGKLGNSPLFHKLERIDDELLAIDGYDVTLSENLSDYDRNIGFHSFPESGEEYLRGLVEIYAEHLGKAKEAAQEALQI